MPVPDLPIEVVSQIISLVPPPFYPAVEMLSQNSPDFLLHNLDPTPPPIQTPQNLISVASKACPRILEAGRPWLWENVEVRSGRGWLAVVNALTEEVIEDVHAGPSNPISPNPPPSAIPALEAHRQPNTIPGGITQYISPPSSSIYPSYPYPTSSGQGINIIIPPSYSYSPPQPSRLDLLLTPPGSRNSSPNANYISPNGKTDHTSPSPATPSPNPTSSSPSLSPTSRLRGRSRSPRRDIGFDMEGISAIFERSRSPSARPSSSDSWGRRPPVGRRTSLSRARTREEMENDAEEDEEEDEVMLLTSPTKYLLTPPVLEEGRLPSHSEMLPPPGPYIRHLSFVSFRTIGSRRTQDEAVRGRYVTAGRLEGVIKVSASRQQ